MTSSPTSETHRNCWIIDGSARDDGNCRHLRELLSKQLRDDNWYVEDIGVSDLVEPEFCSGCGRCRDGDCRITDGFSFIFDLKSRIDLVILLSPIHFSGLSAQAKYFVDRLNPLWYRHEDVHARFCAILIGGSPEPRFSNAESELKAVSKGCGFEWSGVLELSDSDRKAVGDYDGQALEFVRRVIGN